MKKCLVLLLCLSFLLGNPAEAAVANSQHKALLTNNHWTYEVAGVKTKKKGTNAEKPGEHKKNKQYAHADLDLLARLVHAEAQGEPYLGKVAVAATVLNRIEDPYYPETIPEVIYEYDHGFQYCPVRNGAINYPADEQSWQAVREALQGKDPTGGALSFFNPAKSGNTWINGRPFMTKIGNHVFVK